jgi:Fe-S oxidoreductase
METKKSERFSDIRITQAREMGADVLVTACPYCMVSFEAGFSEDEAGRSIQVKDISELVLEAL